MRINTESKDVERARVVLPCRDLEANLAFFTDRLGFRIERISPADNPREVDLGGHGVGLLLQKGPADHNGVLRFETTDPARVAQLDPLVAPNGTSIEFVAADRGVDVPPLDQSLVISRMADSEAFAAGRAGMGYRDLIPNRQGGRFIASHIRIEGGGPVPDYAHFHKIRFQMIFCYRGWVRVAYEDQGEPFMLEPGDCVLQPPEIRHRVLESSPGLEVIEIGCPAEHDTFADHEVTLPTGVLDPARDFGGQRFVHHVAKAAGWHPWRLSGFDCRHIGIAEATGGLAAVRVLRPSAEGDGTGVVAHNAEFLFFFVLEGAATFGLDGDEVQLTSGDSIVVPAGMPHSLEALHGSELLEVALPADVPTAPSGALA